MQEGPGALQGCAEGRPALGAPRVMRGVGTGRGLVAVACTGEGRLVGGVCWCSGSGKGLRAGRNGVIAQPSPSAQRKDFSLFFKASF